MNFRSRVQGSRLLRFLPVLAGALVATTFAHAQPVPNGPEFQINTYSTSGQQRPSVAVAGQGRFVVVWQSDGSSGSDTGWSIQGQRYDANGAADGVEFQINTYSTNNQLFPAVAMNDSGNFVVVWESRGSNGTDTSFFSIQGQRFDASGDPMGGEFQVNTYTTSYQLQPAVAMDPSGNFVVVWESDGSSGTDTSFFSIQGQLYDADGATVGGQFQINTYSTNDQLVPSVAMNEQGDFIVLWESDGSSGSDADWSIQGQRFDASGLPVGSEFQVNSYTTGVQRLPSVASNLQGDFVAVWSSNGSSGTDTDWYSVQGQRYDSSGAPLGAQFEVNSYTTHDQTEPSVASDDSNSFVVLWQSRGSSGSDTNSFSIQGQRYRADGLPVDGEFQVNTYTTDGQILPAVAVDGPGNFVVAWTSYGSGGSDTESYSIQGQRYDGLFRDGFESGDTSRWSSAFP